MDRRWVVSLRYVDTDVNRARWRGTVNLRVLPMLQIGAEVNVAEREVGPLATWFLVTESHTRPAVFVGTSSDRIGSPEGEQAYYLTVAKHAPRFPVSAYASLNYSEWDDGINLPFGATIDLGRNFSLRPMYDGDRTHLLLNYTDSRAVVSLLWVWLEQPGMAVSFGF